MRATVLGAEEDVDVAVLTVERELASGWLSWVDANELQVGQEVVALGYPVPDMVFSARPSTVVSFQGVGRTRDALLLDGLVDRGNSGGPVLTSNGEVAGVATALLGPDATGGLQWIGVAYTYDYLADAISQIRRERPGWQVRCDAPFTVPIAPEDWDWEEVPEPGVNGANRYGDDAYLDSLYNSCADGDLVACDDLYVQSSYGSEYEEFGGTCGNTSEAYGRCVWEGDTGSPPETPTQYGDDPYLDSLYDSCADGDLVACDDLYWQSDYGSEYEEFGASCGGHVTEPVPGGCAAR